MLIISNGCLAFTTSVAVSLPIKRCSAFAFSLVVVPRTPLWLNNTRDIPFVCRGSSSGPTTG